MNWYCIYSVDRRAQAVKTSTSFFTAESDEAALRTFYDQVHELDEASVFDESSGDYRMHLYSTTFTDAEYAEYREQLALPCHPLINPNDKLNQLATFWKELQRLTWDGINNFELHFALAE